MNDRVNIISTYDVAQRFRKMSKFELDLGKRNMQQQGNNGPTVFKIYDNFVKHVFDEYGYLINKIGNYGSIQFFYTSYAENNKIYVFYNNVENEVSIPIDVSNIEEWLSEQLYIIKQKLEDGIEKRSN